MKKILASIILIIGIVIIFSIITKKETISTDEQNEQTVYRNTISISRTYVALRLKTDKVLKEASTYPDYDTWNDEMTELINNWKNLEEKAELLESQADFGSDEAVSFKIVNEAHAYSKEEISNVFDKAPAGKKIRTLAKYLGVDAKRAFKILENDQEFVKADAWNEAGDTFKKLEVSAIIIKDGCKVAGFIGAAAMTGGASVGGAGVGTTLLGGTATLTEGTIMIITGTDLMLEVGEDAATIILGDSDSKAVKAISKIRSVTDPAASILSLKDIPKNISKGAKLLDKVGVVLLQVDQIRSMTQDGKLLGINISSDSKVEMASIEKGEVKEWLDENTDIEIQVEKVVETGEGSESEEVKAGAEKIGDEEEIILEEDGYFEDLEEWLDSFEDLDDWLDEFETESDLELESEGEINDEDSVEELKDTEENERVEENFENVEKIYGKDGKVSVAIIEPSSNVLEKGATQRWRVAIDNYEREGAKLRPECSWTYYVDENLMWENTGSCDYASGLYYKDLKTYGKLRATVKIEFPQRTYGVDELGNQTMGKEVLETISLEKLYDLTPASYFLQ